MPYPPVFPMHQVTASAILFPFLHCQDALAPGLADKEESGHERSMAGYGPYGTVGIQKRRLPEIIEDGRLDCPPHEGIDRTFQREDMPATGEAGRHISRGETLRKIAADQGTLRRRPLKSITRPATVTSSHVSGSGTAWMARSLPPVKTPPSKSAS